MALKQWVRLPSGWIQTGGLRNLPWRPNGIGSDNTAALMTLTAIAHTADEETGITRATYNQLCDTTGLSRAKLSNGLDVLQKLRVIEATPKGRSTYKLADYDAQRGWAKLPAKGMYAADAIAAFSDFRLRRAAELEALKLFFLFVAQRDRTTNLANISYDKIEQQTAIERVRIKTALSLLASLSLVYVEHIPSRTNELGIANAYRIVGVDPHIHMGTRGRGMNDADYSALS